MANSLVGRVTSFMLEDPLLVQRPVILTYQILGETKVTNVGPFQCLQAALDYYRARLTKKQKQHLAHAYASVYGVCIHPIA